MKKVYDLEFQGQPSRSRVCFNSFHILDLENVSIDTKIDLIRVMFAKGHAKKCLTLHFQGQTSRSGD